MNKLITTAASAAMERLRDHIELVGLSNTDEATFRSFFLAALKQRCPNARCQTEWHRVDLLVQQKNKNALIEFKYYLKRYTLKLDGAHHNGKGGPGKKNEEEFWNCIHQLNTDDYGPIHHKYLILVYQRGTFGKSTLSFDRSYGDLAPNDAIARIIRVPNPIDELLACKVLCIR